jgi:hypothetical protein
MKKIVLFYLFIVFSVHILYAQNCVQCDPNSNPSGTYASVIGMSTTATSDGAFAGGFNSHAEGFFAFAFGNQVTAFGANSLAIGRYLQCNTSTAMILGTGPEVNNRLINSVSNSLMVGFNSTKPTLFVGPSYGDNNTGKVGIGNVTDPQAKLHIKADQNETASLFIEPYLWGGNYNAYLFLGTMEYGLRALYGKLEFKTSPGGCYVFYNDNVGIGTYNPTEKLEVVGKIKTTNLQLTNGFAQGKLLQSDAAGNAFWTEPAWSINGNNACKMNGNVGIGTTNPSEKLEVNGKIKTSYFQMATGCGNGKLLQSDTEGNGVWTSPAWNSNGTTAYKINGNVGIGTGNPQAPLEISRNITILGKSGLTISNPNVFRWFLGMNHDDYEDNVFVITNHDQMSSGSPYFAINANGTLGIGTLEVDDNYKLNVNGYILAEEVKIVENVPSSDFVFEDDYHVMSVGGLEEYIKINRHLPDIPSAAEFREHGYEVGRMDDLLLRKIEELTLYVIAQQKEIDALKARLNVAKN